MKYVLQKYMNKTTGGIRTRVLIIDSAPPYPTDILADEVLLTNKEITVDKAVKYCSNNVVDTEGGLPEWMQLQP